MAAKHSLHVALTKPHVPSDGRGTGDSHYKAIFESAVDFAIVATDSDGLVNAWNMGAERTLGWSAKEMIGERVERFFTPEDQAEGRPEIKMQEALATGRATDERWHMKKDGSRFYANGEMMPLRDETGALYGFVKFYATGRSNTKLPRRPGPMRSSCAACWLPPPIASRY